MEAFKELKTRAKRYGATVSRNDGMFLIKISPVKGVLEISLNDAVDVVDLIQQAYMNGAHCGKYERRKPL